MGIFKLEKEIISISPFNFDLEDIKYVISNSLMTKYYEIPKEIKDKLLLLEDYCSAKIAEGSPLWIWLEKKVAKLKKMNVMGVGIEVFIAFQILNGIITHPEWKQHVTPIKGLERQIPDRWEIILKNIHHLSNNRLRMSIINYIFRHYIWGGSSPNKDYEDNLYKKVLKNL